MARPKKTENVNTTTPKTEAPKEKKPKKPREKVRSVEEIYDMSVSKLTNREKDALIKALREQTVLLKNQNHQYKQSAESAFEKARDTENRYDSMEKFYRDNFKELNLQLSAYAATVTRITGGIN